MVIGFTINSEFVEGKVNTIYCIAQNIKFRTYNTLI